MVKTMHARPRRRKTPRRVAPRSPRRFVEEQWATIGPPDRRGLHHICLWGPLRDRQGPQADDIICDPDERICVVRVEVLEVLDEDGQRPSARR